MRGVPILILLAAFLAPRIASADPVSFRNEVVPVLSRGGCNQGACHGNLNGKGGFKLSLRGEDSLFDHSALTRDLFARRCDVQNPEESLLLKKATGQVPHEGGPRFGADSSEYRILLQWIRDGARDDSATATKLTKLEVTPTERILLEPEESFAIAVQATYADGSRRDLKSLAVFETTSVGLVTITSDGTVRKVQNGETTVVVRYQDRQIPVTVAFVPHRSDFRWPDATQEPLTHPIDARVAEQLRKRRITPSPLADDATFHRRLSLDLLGILPNATDARAFLKDASPDKRTKLVDRLLNRPEFADYWAQKWSDLLRNEEKALDRKGVRVFHQWIRDAIDRGMPLNEFARRLIAARGSTYTQPESNLYRSLREPYARSESIAQVFLGIRLQCAKCHNHPFDRWTQDDYHQFAALFSRVDYRIAENKRRDNLDKHEFDGEQIVFDNRSGGLKHPRSGEIMHPRLLDSTRELAFTDDPLTRLADWVADPKNPFFAKAQVNRVWYHLFGRGLVEPNDDFRASNPAVNEPLLDDLAREFAGQNFDLRRLVRHIATSRTYQRSSNPSGTNGDDELHFSKSQVQPLEAEQLFDAVSFVAGSRPKFDGYPRGTRAGQVAAMPQERRSRKGAMAERFLKAFGKPERLLTCECERSDDTGLMQAFSMLTGELLQELLSDPNNRIGKLLDDGKTDREMLETFLLTALGRFPTNEESQRLGEFIAKSANRRAAWEDIVWGLVNSKEFLLRR
jgi:Protein of unknown function (DUF1549)/Protein of unknown function (DUF1553)